MITFKYSLVCGFLIWAIRAVKQDSSIILSAKYSYQHIVLICEIKKNVDENFNMYLKCPLGTNQICYANCEPACKSGGCIEAISDCSKNSKDDIVQIQWRIDLTKVNKTGKWQCMYGSKYSNMISVEKQAPIVNTVATNKPDVITEIPVEEKPDTPIFVRITEAPEKATLFQENDNIFWVFITNPNVVLILICVFTASLLFNIFFLVRCALLRSLIDQYIHSNKIPDSCLYRCFCIKINDGLPPVGTKSVPNPTPVNTFMGYHREDVYDDMSATSQAERHLINNYSQYELEQDFLLGRKFWNTDGSQSLIGRSPQFYAGTPKNNYVIVSGPVCSNRSHGPFLPSTTGSILNSQRTCITDEMAQSSSHDSNKNESSICNDSIIYSQPVKNRPKSMGQFNEGDSIKLSDTFPPAPPIRTCTDTQCYLAANPCMENIHPPITMKNVDLIEHCTHSSIKNLPQEMFSN